MMRINPLYILALVVVLFLISISNLQNTKESLSQSKQENKQYLEVANEYQNLNKNWGKNSNSESKLNNILKVLDIQNISVNKKNKKIEIVIKDADIKKIDKLINKILNENIVIKSLYLTKNDFNMEIVI